MRERRNGLSPTHPPSPSVPMPKVVCIAVAEKGSPVKILAEEQDLMSFSFFQRGR
ncbi:hypothetical protein BDK51DRAFT_43549 [Blyttiomyces helicus]|uniref:Uncharacterized protein n=1 Tax=Blyttiomyces helicus TaxID=388810 RepID=A0A4P9W239_9FUNG|nr:hypothetical protein BDK51DRAFT_43549 [Blyttiomyces helicus]|eukprot:RKO86271.1 hypothetical protein BDK51DRAFT_43549 [Blyttiomyces helicus]